MMDNKNKNTEVLSVQIVCVTEQKVGLGKWSSKFWEFGSKSPVQILQHCCGFLELIHLSCWLVLQFVVYVFRSSRPAGLYVGVTPLTDTTIFFWSWVVFLFFVLFVTCVFTDWLIDCVCVCVQNFIRRCLQYKKELRPDVVQMANEDYLKPAALKSKWVCSFVMVVWTIVPPAKTICCPYVRVSMLVFWLSCVDSCASSKGGLLPSSQSVCSLLVCGELSGQGASCFKRCLCEKVILCLGRCLCEIQTHKVKKNASLIW